MATRPFHPANCHCCSGIDAETPLRVLNPPGLPGVDYRAGRHGEFLESMLARLSSTHHPALAALTTRGAEDHTVAFADGMAVSLDILTFYMERYAQEHYLRTARERYSVQEMARLIGYRLNPGVAAGTHLAFTLQAVPGAPVEPIVIPVGTRVQSVPGQGEKAQSFETVEVVTARADWNAIPVQTSQPWRPVSGDRELWLDGVETRLRAGDAILILGAARLDDPGDEHWDVRVLAAVEPDPKAGRTRVRWDNPLGSVFPPMDPASLGARVYAFRERSALFGHNAPNPNLVSTGGGTGGSNLINTSGSTRTWKNYVIDPDSIDIDSNNREITVGSWVALVSNEPGYGSETLPGYTELVRVTRVTHRSRSDFGLSGKITRVVPDTTEHITTGRYALDRALVLAHSERLATTAIPWFHPVYGETLSLVGPVEGLVPGQALALSGHRQKIRIGARAEGLELLPEAGEAVPLAGGDELWLLAAPVRLVGAKTKALSPSHFADRLQAGNTLFGLLVLDRDGRRGTLQAHARDLELAAPGKDDPVVHELCFIGAEAEAISSDRHHTHLDLQQPLAHVYHRSSLRANANVAPATHGESVSEILGDGDGGGANQSFRLAQGPLTYVSAGNPSGSASTLEVRVNDVLWSERRTLYGAAPDERAYRVVHGEDGALSVTFGDGEEGARLPSGSSNVRARYRKSIGRAGNVAAGKLTTLLQRPLGVSDVTNPVPATGGDDPESLGRARENAPLTVLTLDRAVSIEDYADYARAFAGVDKAHASWVPAGPGRGVFLTIAGVGGAPVPPTSDTYRNLFASLRAHGDTLVPLAVVNYRDVRFRCRLSVKVLAAHLPEDVMAAVTTAIEAHFSFARRDFGRPVSVDEVSAVAQAVPGVEAVHVTRLHRAGQPATLKPRLFAALPLVSLDALPTPAELMRLDDDGVHLELLP